MLADLKYIFAKVLIILIIVFIYYLITKYNMPNKNNDIETFEDKIEKEKINYLKLKETYIEPEGTTLEDNGVRCVDNKYRDLINNQIYYLLYKHSPKNLITLSGSTEQRIAKIKETLFS